MFRSIGLSLVLAAVSIAAAPAGAVERGFVERFCVAPPHHALCSVLPYDQADFDRRFVYMVIVKGAQDPFDVFSWQAFVALNWPADAAGEPLSAAIGEAPAAPRVWQAFDRRDEIFGPDPARAACGREAQDTALLIGDIEQADGSVLVDQNGNFVVYETRANDVVADYIRANGLNRSAGQIAFLRAHEIDFPLGQLPDATTGSDGVEPSLLLKTAWRVLNDPADHDRFFTRPGVVFVPPTRTATGDSLCSNVVLGLVGMHIVMRTHSGNGQEWIWSTFEHADNAPVAANARDVNSIYAEELFPNGCAAPATAQPRRYSFFDPDCADCATNAKTVADWRWSETAPFARDAFGEVAQGAQVVRCWDIFESTAAVNRLWAEKLRGTVWANYMLISTQWRGADRSPLFEHGEVPRYLTNLTMETYQQAASEGTCLGCHAEATTKTGHTADFMFMLRRAK